MTGKISNQKFLPSSSYDGRIKMFCKNCGSPNVNVQVASQSQMKNAPRHGCLYWLLIGWWLQPVLWLFLTLPMLLIALFRPKNKKIVTTQQSIAVCQNCGRKWAVWSGTNWYAGRHENRSKQEAAASGFYEPEYFPGKLYPKVLTIEEIINGKQIEYPRVAPEVTFKKAERKSKGKELEQIGLDLGNT